MASGTRSGLLADIRVFALLPLMIVPLVSWFAIDGIRGALEEQWANGGRASALVGGAPVPLAQGQAHTSLQAACAASNVTVATGLGTLCANYQITSIGKPLAIVSVAITVGLIGYMLIAGLVARVGRILLLILFVPGLYLTMAGVIVLVASNVLLLLAALQLVFSQATGYILPFLLLAIGGAGLVGIIALIRACLSFLGHGACVESALVLPPAEEPELWGFVRNLAARMGAKPPDHIVGGLEPNFYVTEAHVYCYSGMLRGRTMYVSLPLCRILTMPEFEAVLCHELAHYKGLDTRFSGLFYPVYARAGFALRTLGAESDSIASEIVLFPARLIIQTFLDSFALAESRVGRRRELAADRVASQMIGGRHVGSVLMKFHAYSRLWKRVAGSLRQTHEPPPGSNASRMFESVVLTATRPEILENLDGQEPPHPTDTHPPLSERLRALQHPLEDLAAWALVTAPSEPAVNLISHREALEQHLTQHENWLRF